MKVFEELTARGFIAQTTSENKIKDIVNKGKAKFYIGFDPTADSLHVGHFVQMLLISHLQRAGNKAICLFGGGTGMVGDPSGKNDMRKFMTPETVKHNIDCFIKQASILLDVKNITVENNADWLSNLNYIDILREIGVHFSINRMLAAECYKARLESGLTFLELNYMIMQSYDFLVLHKKYGCNLQLGGNDQWSNIISGVELVRKKTSEEVFGLTTNLLTKSDGQKMGKTEKGALWLDSAKTSPYDFYQYWRNIADDDIIKCMKILTFMSLEEISEYEKNIIKDPNSAKEKLALEITALVHGRNESKKACGAAKSVFNGGAGMPEKTITLTNDKINILDLLVAGDIAASKSEARRLINQGGITLDDKKITDISLDISAELLKNGVKIRKGKKIFIKIFGNNLKNY